MLIGAKVVRFSLAPVKISAALYLASTSLSNKSWQSVISVLMGASGGALPSNKSSISSEVST